MAVNSQNHPGLPQNPEASPAEQPGYRDCRQSGRGRMADATDALAPRSIRISHRLTALEKSERQLISLHHRHFIGPQDGTLFPKGAHRPSSPLAAAPGRPVPDRDRISAPSLRPQ